MEGGVIKEPTLGKTETNTSKSVDTKTNMKVPMYILGAATVLAIVASIGASHVTKKKARKYLEDLEKKKVLLENPTTLALKALGWATFWTVGIFSISIFSVCKWFDIKNQDDLRATCRKFMKKPNKSEDKLEFENFSDFLSYYIEESSKKETEKKAVPKGL